MQHCFISQYWSILTFLKIYKLRPVIEPIPAFNSTIIEISGITIYRIKPKENNFLNFFPFVSVSTASNFIYYMKLKIKKKIHTNIYSIFRQKLARFYNVQHIVTNKQCENVFGIKVNSIDCNRTSFFSSYFFSFFFLSVHWSCSIIFFLFQNKSIGKKKWRITLPVSFSHFHMNIFANGQSYLLPWYFHFRAYRWDSLELLKGKLFETV